MAIEWPSAPTSTGMSVDIADNWPAPPAGPPNVLVASIPCTVNITIDVGAHGMTLGGRFQVRAFAESIGPGQELLLGTTTVAVVPGQMTPYNAAINIPGGTLWGEGQIDPVTGSPVSGVYKIVVVMQHMNPGPTFVSGFVEDTFRMFLNP
jgi:hypothetical protein